jgi:DNA-binding transcriptional MerR regulator
MAELTISQVAAQVGLRPSTIRYYEEIGILPPARRVSGQRRFDRATVRRLAVVPRAQEAGFSLDEIRLLVLGAGRASPLSARWKRAAEGKIAELDARLALIRDMRARSCASETAAAATPSRSAARAFCANDPAANSRAARYHIG